MLSDAPDDLLAAQRRVEHQAKLAPVPQKLILRQFA
jgi:hypothetical protein